GEAFEFAPHPLDDMGIEIGGVEGFTGTPCGKTDKADRIAIGFVHLSELETAYHHLAGVNLPAACSMAWAVLNSVSSSNGLPMSCRPSGRPLPSSPAGTERPGRPAMLTVMVKTSCRYI